jgi:hypothetical protein
MEWINVKNQPMPDDKLILVGLTIQKSKWGKCFVQYIARMDSEMEMMEDDHGDEIGWKIKEITHWMPLPEPPKQ